MECRDYRKVARVEHRFRQERAYRMRNCIVTVNQVQTLQLRNLSHLGGKGQRIRRVIEERIGRNFHFVKINAREAPFQAQGRGIDDEVNLMAALSQLLPQRCRYDAASSIGWLAGYADLHLSQTKRQAKDTKKRRLTKNRSGN